MGRRRRRRMRRRGRRRRRRRREEEEEEDLLFSCLFLFVDVAYLHPSLWRTQLGSL